MREVRVANRYAKALFDLAIEKNLVEPVKDDAILIQDVCLRNRELVLLLRSPVIKDTKKVAILKGIFEKKLHDLTFKFLVIIVKNGREYMIPEIAIQIIKIYKKYKNIITANLTTAAKIDDNTRQKIITLLEEQVNAEIELNEDLNEELIGGFVLSFDYMQYDASILRQIKNLHRDFDINLYIKGF